ncbi:MAG: hypothetical protein JO047_12660 [Alphaproteobacteria bacterium]|nr:hypothetical protein [Alphaproteobacteria bacterium]
MSAEERRPWRRFLPWLALLLLPVAVHWPALSEWMAENPIYLTSGLGNHTWAPNGLLPGWPWIDGNAGVTTQALGWLVADDWLHGRLPWWNPYSGVGLPLAAEMQPAAFFLPFVLLLHLFDGVTLLRIAMQSIAGVATFALLRQLGIGARAAFVGAVLFALNGSFCWFASLSIMPIAFFPLLLLGIERARMHAVSGARGGWAWITVGIAYSLLAGFPEVAFLDGLLALAWLQFRLATLPAGRGRFGLKVFWGGGLGLLLAAPAVLPFVVSLPDSFIGHHVDFSFAGFLPATYAMLLFPHIYGPPLYALDVGEQSKVWFSTGGYFDFALLLLSIVALLGPGRERGLRRLLALWIVLTLGKAARVPALQVLLDWIPLLRQTIFRAYIEPSWQMAGVVLAALALDDWHRGLIRGRKTPVVAVCAAAVLGVVAVLLGWNDIAALLREAPGYAPFPLLSIGFATLVAALLALALIGQPSRGRSIWLCALIVGEALALFTVPLLCGTRDGDVDWDAAAFLQRHLGLQRVYSLDALVPNYGARFGVALLNHNYLPVPQAWVDYLRANLMPGMDGINFFGGPHPAALLRDNLARYEAAGVKYVAVQPGENPFVDNVDPAITGPGTPVLLDSGTALSGTVPVSLVRPGTLGGIRIMAASTGAQAGELHARICAGSHCAEGAATTARSGGFVAVVLAPPLPVGADDQITYRISADGALVVWTWPWAGAAARPWLKLAYALSLPLPQPVFRGSTMDLFELPHPAPYFATEPPGCVLDVQSRSELAAECGQASVLVRRELRFPGWRASVDGRPVPIRLRDEIFQAIALPPGRSLIRFSYAPPHIAFAWVMFGLGILGCVAGWAVARGHGIRWRPAARSGS